MRKVFCLMLMGCLFLQASEEVENGSEDSGLFFDVAYLFLKPEVDGLSPGQTIDLTSVTQPSDVVNIKDRPKDLDFRWSSGLYAGVGYRFSQRDQLELSAYWTYLHSTADKNVAIKGDVEQHYFAPGWLPLLLGSVADKAKANWTLNFNVADLALSKNVMFGNWISIEPRAGLRAAWINQDYVAKYHGGYIYSDAGVRTTIFRDTSFTGSNDFKGIGARVGSDLQFYFTENFSLLGSFFASLLYGEFELREKYDGGLLVDFGFGPQILSEVLNLRKDFSAVRPAIESKIGLNWNKYFNQDRNRIALGVYYQLAYWFGQNELIDQTIARDSTPLSATAVTANNNLRTQNVNGDLQLQGLEVELRLDF